ncbi:ammonia channel protein [Candidatus Omnitrophus magneticus]|uniref:Ammonium transporter n=1 Tax=Candidatus Omnitrophus magneticus TaxID=1609969 RepID=A0A0F0CND1_9BACT|nr:ammonia channel protein [Candidatus Omnitrophus magneticus]
MVNFVDTLFVLFSAALVMLMTPGLALFYGGMVRRKNVLSVLMQCMIALCLITLQWMLFGYSLSFAPGNGFWGGFDWLGLNGVGFQPFADYSSTIPNQVFMFYQMMFAVITPALIIGAFAERMKFSAFLIFALLWATFVYDPICHWVWGSGGWLKNLGGVDFAGGIVVHTSAGIAALATAIIIGKRKFINHLPSPHNLPLVLVGTGLLWFGWFGFNGGSALAVNGVAVNAFITTNASSAAAGLSWALLEWVRNGKPTLFGVITGSIAGLATITPASGFVSPGIAILIGVLASIVCFIGVAVIKPKFGYDDSLDAFGVHGIGGILGTLATGLFASKLINPAGVDGLLFGNPKQFLIQVFGVLVVSVYTFVVTFIIYKLVDVFFGIRVKEQDEAMGLDLTQHHERAYTILE